MDKGAFTARGTNAGMTSKQPVGDRYKKQFTYLCFNAYLLNTYCVPQMVSGAGNTALNEIDEVSAVVKLLLYWREISNNQTNKKHT